MRDLAYITQPCNPAWLIALALLGLACFLVHLLFLWRIKQVLDWISSALVVLLKHLRE